MRLLEEWLPYLASMSGVVLPVWSPSLDDRETPSLDQQLQDILDYVAFQELNRDSPRPRWRAGRGGPKPM
jgi:hypothetical protein